MKDRLLSEVALTPDQLKAIGCVAIESTLLETHIEVCITALCEFDENAAKIFLPQRMAIAQKLRVLNDLLTAKAEGTPFKETLRKLRCDIDQAITRRNTVIHGDWSSNLKLGDIARQKTDAIAKRKWGRDTIAADEIMQLAQTFDRLRMDLLEWWLGFFGDDEPSRETPLSSHGENHQNRVQEHPGSNRMPK